MGLYAPALVVFIISIVGAFSVGYSKGSSSRNPEIAEYQAAIKVSQKLADEAEARFAAKATEVVTVYKDKVKTIREVTPGEIQVIERVVREAGVCELPPSFRSLWDGRTAPNGQDIKDSSGVNAAPVTVADLAAGVTEARKRYQETAARLEALQGLVNSQ